MINHWSETIAKIKYAIEYGFHCNDLSHRDMEEEICSALDRLGKENGMPEIDWEATDDND